MLVCEALLSCRIDLYYFVVCFVVPYGKLGSLKRKKYQEDKLDRCWISEWGKQKTHNKQKCVLLCLSSHPMKTAITQCTLNMKSWCYFTLRSALSKSRELARCRSIPLPQLHFKVCVCGECVSVCVRVMAEYNHGIRIGLLNFTLHCCLLLMRKATV